MANVQLTTQKQHLSLNGLLKTHSNELCWESRTTSEMRLIPKLFTDVITNELARYVCTKQVYSQ